ncbi:MAG: hypothetical protein WKG07_08390 [Hymenobacter sp.]
MEVRAEGHLIAAGIFDQGTRSLAGIVNFYDPDYRKYSLGKYLMLYEIRIRSADKDWIIITPATWCTAIPSSTTSSSPALRPRRYSTTSPSQWLPLQLGGSEPAERQRCGLGGEVAGGA